MKHYLLFLWSFFIITYMHAQHKEKILVTSADKTSIPEGIAIDQQSGTIYISSINHHNILKIDRKGKAENFLHAGSEGFLEGLGMKIDRKRNLLWAVSNLKEKGVYTSQLQAFDLKTGREKQRYHIRDTVQHLFNDLVMVRGVIYITDTYFSAIYKVDTRHPELKLYKKHEHLTYPNGITADLANERLFVASYKHGIIMIDLRSDQSYILTGTIHPKQILGLDGIVFYHRSIAGIYNLEDRSQHAVMQYYLSEDGRSIKQEKVIDRGNPLFYEPTTAAIRKNKLYVLANSHLNVFNGNKESTTGVEEKLTAPAIIIYSL